MTSVADMVNEDVKAIAKPSVPKRRRPKPKAKKKKGDTGKRYTEAQKKAILSYAKKLGRGGITAAMRKYNVSYIAFANWQKGPKKPGRPKGSVASKLKPDPRMKRMGKAFETFAKKLAKILK